MYESANGQERRGFGTFVRKALFLSIWLALVGWGFKKLVQYEMTPGRMVPLSGLPAEVAGTSGEFSIVMALHPKCPCSRASLDELSAIVSRAPKIKITVLAFKPGAEADVWIQGESLKRIEMIEARIIVDPDGAIAAAAGFTTSGQVRLYSPKGEMLYDGGITGGRGHRGENAGRAAVLALVRGETAPQRGNPTFGCSL